MSKLERPTRLRVLLQVVYPPVIWGIGAALLSVIGFSDIVVPLAFFVGFCVGLVHDLVLVAMGVMGYGSWVFANRVWRRLGEGVGKYEEGEWGEALGIFTEILDEVPSYQSALYYAVCCQIELENWEEVESLSDQYLRIYPDEPDVIKALGQARQNQ
ncbi:MAG: tetratricopeptide repeat protein [Candidatus Thorarchaeota archaeon]